MLNPFPIQFLALLAYAALRVVAGVILLYLGITHLRHRSEIAPILRLPFFPFGRFMAWYLAVCEIIIGAMLIAGFLTQIAALLGIFLALKFIVMGRRWSHPSFPPRVFYLLLCGVFLSLFITGAGAFAFDLPI